MIRFENSVVINRPVEEVFEFVSNFNNDPLWQPAFQEGEITSEGPIGVGTTGRNVIRFLGRTIESTIEMTEYEENRKLGVRTTSGPTPAKVVDTFEPVEGGTRLTQNFEAEVGGFLKLAEPVVGRMVKRQQQNNFANLKDLLEAGGS